MPIDCCFITAFLQKDDKAPLNAFQVKPAGKWYRFAPKPKHRILTTEEAEATLKKKTLHGERWMMQKRKVRNGLFTLFFFFFWFWFWFCFGFSD
jgi:hypothetical protein